MDVELVKRQDVGSERAPSVVQLIGMTVRGETGTFDLRQAQVLLAFLDVENPSRRSVVILTCTTTSGQFDDVGPEFQAFVASVRPVPQASD